jgi:hypothetical protein
LFNRGRFVMKEYHCAGQDPGAVYVEPNSCEKFSTNNWLIC